MAARLREAAEPGQPVLLLFPPGLEFLAGLFGCVAAGCIAVPVHPPFFSQAAVRLRSILRDLRPAVGLTSGALRSQIEAWCGELPELAAMRWLDIGVEPAECGYVPARPDPESVLLIQYTSGSTADPKGVMLTHRSLMSNLEAMRAWITDPGEVGQRGLSWLPPYHDLGFVAGIMAPFYGGRPGVLLPTMAFASDPLCWLRAISRYGATHSGAPNFAYQLCVDAVTPAEKAELDLTSWRVAYCGAEPIRADTLRAFAEEFEPCGFRESAFRPGYGLAESTLIVTIPSAPRPLLTLPVDSEALGRNVIETGPGRRAQPIVANGSPAAGHEVRIVATDTLQPQPDGYVGEVWAAGPSVAAGYWRRPEESRRTFGATLPDSGRRYLRTGDLGFLKDGELYITGRLKELLILRGRNVYPQDVERTVERAHEALRPGAGAAFSVQAGGEERLVIAHELHRHMLRRLDAGEVASAVRAAVVRDHGVEPLALALLPPWTIPLTTSGKIQRRACRDLYLAGTLDCVASVQYDGAAARSAPRAGAANPPAGEAAIRSVLVEIAAQHLGVRPEDVPLDAEVTDFLDSLSLVDLRAAAQRRGLAIAPEWLFQPVSLAGLARLLASEPGRTEAAPIEGLSLPPVPPRWWFKGGPALRFFDAPLGLIYRRYAAETRTAGLEHLRGLPRQVILAGSHRSYLDSRAIGRALQAAGQGRRAARLALLAGAETLGAATAGWSWLPVLGLGLFPVQQRGDIHDSIRRLAHGVPADCSILVHPQGSHCDFRLEQAGVATEDFRPGVALLAQRLSAPVLPFGLAGTERIIPPKPPAGFRGRTIGDLPLRARRGVVAVVFGRPMAVGADEDARAFTARLQAECYRLNQQAEALRS